MSRHSLYRRIIAQDAGAWAEPGRWFLRAAESFYSCIVALRNARYDRTGARVVLPIPVISVGNITVGGTGKTPFVIELLKRLDGRGFSPVVVSRGYKAGDGEPNDEERLIRQSCPSVVCVSDPDRALAGEVAHRRFGADVIVLDDGFQHRRLHRVLDIVLVDATCPFGFDHLLPRGLLREPVDSLRRAHVVVLTRCDQVSQAALLQIRTRLCGLAGDALHLKCSHRVTSIEDLSGNPAKEHLAGKRAVLFAGIGCPGTFATTVRSLGVDVVGERWWADHHHYRRRDIESLLRCGRFPPHDFLITTEKDAVKLVTLGGFGNAPILVIKIAIDFTEDDGTMLQTVLDETLGRG